jgi:hypothetical protein
MKIPENLNKYQLFSLFGSLVLGLEFLAILLTVSGFFYRGIFISYFIFAIFIFFLVAFHNKKALKSSSAFFIVFLLSAFLISLSMHAEPTVFSGRDQGSFSEAAIRLSQNHQLSFQTTASQEFFKIHGPGIAQNFPGFDYTQNGKLITHFSLGYIAWLAVFYSFFGLSGFSIANGLSFFIFSITFLALTKLYTNQKTAYLSLFLVLSSFVFSWFFKFTLSENLALSLVWFSILELCLFLKFKERNYFFLSFLSIALLAFTRIETWGFIAMLVIAFFIIFKKNTKKHFQKISKNFYWLFGVFFLLYIISIKINKRFYVASLKGLLRSFSASEMRNSTTISASSYLFKIFALYDILPFLIIALIGIIYFTIKKKYILLLPLFIILPTFTYLFHPGISLDYPWMLRRFTFTLIPCFIFYTALTANQLIIKKNIFYLFSILLISSNLLISMPYFTFSENNDLLKQTQALSDKFSTNDLILVDRLTSGDGWSMLSGPLNFLYGKQAVYFFNPQDLDKINLTKFSKVYLIVPDESLTFYEKNAFLEKFSRQESYSISRTHLTTFDPEKVAHIQLELPQEITSATHGSIYLLKK